MVINRLKKLLKPLFPTSLWTRWYTYWWVVSFAVLLLFDLLWMGQTTFRPFTMLPYYPYLLLCSTLLASTAVISHRPWLPTSILFLINVWQVCNLMYCNTYLNAIPAQSYLLVGNLADFTDSVVDSFRWYYLSLPLLTAAAAYFSTLYRDSSREKPRVKPLCATITALAFISWSSDCWRGGPLANMEALSNECYKSTCVAPVYSLGGYLIHDISVNLGELSPEDKELVDNWLEKHKKITQPTDSVANRPKNLVMILCESLESWPIGTIVDNIELTPVLNKLIADSTTFYAPNVVTQAASGRSIDAQLLMLAGMLPMQNSVYSFKAPNNQYFTLPKAMKSHGGKSYLLTCDKPHTWNQLNVCRAFGFDTFLHDTSWENTEPVGTARRLSDGEFLRQITIKMGNGEIWQNGENAFITIVTYSGHNPFKLPEKLQLAKFDNKYPEIVRNYMTTVNYTDNSLAVLINYLKSRPDWEETIVVIAGDHEGLAGQRKMAVKDSHAGKFVDPVEHTPFIVLNSPITGHYEGEVGQVDIYSTLLDLMGWHDYSWQGMGQSIANDSHPGVAIGKAGDTQGDTDTITAESLQHLRDARQVSDRIIRHNLLK